MLGQKGLTIRSRKITVPASGTLKTEKLQTEVNVGRLVGLHITADTLFAGSDTVKVMDKNNRDLLPQLPIARHRNNVTGTFLSTVIPVDYEANGEPITVEIVCAADTKNDRHIFLEHHYQL